MMRKISVDSDDSIVKHDVNSYNSLKERACHRCEFCDNVFTTRYSMIKHNATHIIIPLLKLKLHQCEDCLFYFSSLEDLHIHVTDKLHITSQFPQESQESKLGEYAKILQSFVEKQVVVKCHDTLNEVLNPTVKREADIPKTSPTLTPKIENNFHKIENNFNDGVTYEISDSDEGSLDGIHSIHGKGQSNHLKGQSNTEKGQNNRENGQSNTENGQSKSEKGQSKSEKGQSKSEKGQSDTELDIKKEERVSSPFDIKDLSSPSRELSSPMEPVHHRIMFEDDYDDDDLFEAEEILPDKPYYPPKLNSSIISHNLSKHINKNSFVVGSKVCNTSQENGTLTYVKNEDEEGSLTDVKDEEEYTESVHYDELVEAELCDCRYCGRCFCNRLELIKHECTHMRASPARPIICSVCERYLAGNYWALRRHMSKYHPDNDRKLIVQQCKICNLNYHNQRRHIKYYHQIKCDSCKRSYFKRDLPTHDCVKINRLRNVCDEDNCKVIKMCEMCLAFCKNRQNIHYEVIGELSEIGRRQQCDRCQNMRFEVSLVSRRVRVREASDYLKRRKPMSNKDRLKKMQNRLKMVNKMNKC